MNKKKYNIVIISGPTGMGKTQASLALYDELFKKGVKSRIVNFDSLLFYKDLNIGTAKPTKKEMQSIPHEFIDITTADNPIDASLYRQMAEELINCLLAEGVVPILVGGSAFYLRALIKGMYGNQSLIDEKGEVAQKLKKEVNQMETSDIREALKTFDLNSFNTIHKNDRYRLTRAYLFYKTHHKPISEEKNKFDQENAYDFTKPINPNWRPLHIYLNMPKTDHYPLIQNRAMLMLKSGLISEVEQLLSSGLDKNLKPLQSIGYKEVIDFLETYKNAPCAERNIDALAEKIFISTRQLAKAQRTFFNKISPKIEYHPLNHGIERIVSFIVEELNKGQNYEKR